ncbi:putative transcription factor interactor and regulator CCHC(Zn) family [Helianthus annuus]|uniref:Transcription factor interactor and regulator CCHC(Zn) family n=1 Tax=Helianthus annuus TaxID=4232 RepID=A0A9K3GXU6_HELAN|nr:putative transcription factor interactor and regulator CCHC(Zn) family [Helianthus annuus]KAJ0820844.1 putative transcription factor interactor and regulator CCHC(Zn) family [Helianthus annuus]
MDTNFFNMNQETIDRINVLTKEFGLFSGYPGESTKSIIDWYSHLVRSMSEKGIQKNPNEWVKRLANSIPQQEWGTYLLELKRNGEYSRLSICQFIKKLEEQMENNDVNKKNQEEKSVSSDESSEESIVVIKHQLILVLQMKVPKEHSFLIKHHLTLIIEAEKVTEAEKVIEVEKIIEIEKIVEVTKPCLMCLESCKQCIEKDERFSELEKLKEQLLFDVKNLKKSYDVLNRHVNSLEKTNSEREKALKMLNATMMTKQKEINMYIEECAKLKKELENEAAENERIRRLLQSYKGCDYVMDRIYPTVEGFEAFKDEQPKTRKDTGKKQGVCYNKCPPPIWEGYSPRKPNEEELKQAINIKLESEITHVLPDNIDVTFTVSDTDHESELIKRVVDQVLDKDEESESKSESESSCQSVRSSSLSEKSSKSSGKRVHSIEFLLSKSNLNNEEFEVVYTLNGSDKLYFDKEFPIRGVKPEMIKKVFKLTEINISEIKDENLIVKPKFYTSRVQQRLNKKKGYNSGSSFQQKPNHNRSYKKKGLGFTPPENYKNGKFSKTNTKFVSGINSEEEKKCSFWKQSNQEFLAEKKKNGAYVKKETRTCFRCNEVGHIAWNCPKATNIKQGVSGKLKEVVVDKTESSTEKFKVFKNSTFEVGECSKRFYKRSVKLDNQKWVVKKSEVKSGDESDSTKSEEPQFDESDENSVPSMDDENFPSLRTENFKRKVGKTEVSNQDYSEKDNFDVEKAFNGNVKKIFGKMVDRKVKGVKDFYATKKATYTPTKSELKSPKAGQAWVDIFFA